MGSEWQHTTIGECLNQEGGSILTGPFGTLLKAAEYTSTGVPVISVSEVGFGRIELKSHTPRVDETITERLPKYLLREGDIVFARKGAGTAVERSALVKADQQGWFLGSDGIRVRLPRSIDARYVSYWLQSKQHRNWMKQHAVGTTMPALNEGIVKRIPVSLPPLSEQKRIAHILGTLDEKIELNRRMNATLEAMARALFTSWFVDFDPVRAKMDGRKPAGMDEATAALFPDRFTHAKNESIPAGWRHAAVEEISGINAWTLAKTDAVETVEYVEISEVSRGNVANIATYARGTEPSRARRRLRHGDTVLSTVRPDRGSYFLALNPPCNRVVSTGFAVFTPKKVPWTFLYAALTMPEVFDSLGQLADGGAYPAVRPEIIGAIKITVTNEPRIVNAFHRQSTPLLEHSESSRNASLALAEIRDTLLCHLM